MMRNVLVLFVVLSLAACGGARLVGSKSLPDETVVLDAPPLTLPPNFDLRPPRSGEGNGEDVLRQYEPQPIEEDDAWLIKEAGRSDPNIRQKLAAPVEPMDAEQENSGKESEAIEQEPQSESEFWNIWGGWKPADEQK